MSDERVPLTTEEAIRRLPDREMIHTIREAGPFILGADCPREKVLARIEKFEVEESGPRASASGHGLCLKDEIGWLFIEANDEDRP